MAVLKFPAFNAAVALIEPRAELLATAPRPLFCSLATARKLLVSVALPRTISPVLASETLSVRAL